MANLFPLIPLSISILFAIKVVLIYLIAVYYDHVNPLYPYLSDAGSTHPEAGFFSMFLILEGILIGIFGWIRFKQIRYIFSSNSEINSNNNIKSLNETQIKKINKYNKYGLYWAIIAMLGIEGVAAFRSLEHLVLHGLSALPAFIAVFVYFGIQSWISFKLIPNVNTKRVAYFRVFITIFAFILFIIMWITALTSWLMLKIPFNQAIGVGRLKWDETYGGYVSHYISAISENLVIFLITPFFASFYTEFKRIRSHNGRLKFTYIGQNMPV